MSRSPSLDGPTTHDLVDVLFGASENPDTVRDVLKAGPHLFVTALATPEMSDAVAQLVCDRACAERSTFAVSADGVRELVVYFFKRIYGSTTVDRIGVDTVLAVQRTLHDCVVGVGRTFQSLHLAGTPPADWQPALGRALDVLLELTQALRSFLPSANASIAWTDAHVLAHALKNTEGSVLHSLSAACNNLPMLLLCDGLLGEILEEDPIFESTPHLGSGFGTCAYSKHWRRVAKFAGHARVGRLMKNSERFIERVEALRNRSRPPRPDAFAPSRSQPDSRPASPTTRPSSPKKRCIESPDDACKRYVAPRREVITCDLGM